MTHSKTYALPPGVDFGAELVKGLLERFGADQRQLAQTQVFVTTARMRGQVQDALTVSGPTLWPKLRLLADLSRDPSLTAGLPALRSKLTRRLELSQLIGALAQTSGAMTSRGSRFSLAASLDDVLAEFQRAGLSLSDIPKIDLQNSAQHWQIAQKFLALLSPYLEVEGPLDADARLRFAIQKQAEAWHAKPPSHPVILAGSTGSREETRLLMTAIASLPYGAVVLPGFDDNTPNDILEDLQNGALGWDHPQAALSQGLRATGVLRPASWTTQIPPNPPRNRIISLALAPAPVTDRWLSEGPSLADELETALADLTLMEAPTPRAEALGIALALRKAVEDKLASVLITPDRTLARQVTTHLTRWGIVPDDSAGRPLHQTPPGVFLRLLCNLLTPQTRSLDLIAFLKHPLCCADSAWRNEHLRRIRWIEARIIRKGPPKTDFTAITKALAKDHPSWSPWWHWISQLLTQAMAFNQQTLADWTTGLRDLAQDFSSGPDTVAGPEIWQKATGTKAHDALRDLQAASDAAGPLTAQEFRSLLHQTLAERNVTESISTNPLVAIWGTQEARVGTRDLVVLAGLNEGVWPARAQNDPWLNRTIRAEMGLAPPERENGLSAHDFQQAVSAKRVILSRSLRDGDAPTVASRWLLRLENLLEGLKEPGRASLAAMRGRADSYLASAALLDRYHGAVTPVRRPAPNPPIMSRPRALSVTPIETLVRDPYAIYAGHILQLRAMDPLGRTADAKMRGTALHKVIETFNQTTNPKTRDVLIETARTVLRQEAPSPLVYTQWLGRVTRIADWLIALEANLAKTETLFGVEKRGTTTFPEIDFVLSAKTDRINVSDAGVHIFDYKTGSSPTNREINAFAKQLPLTALIAAEGGFSELGSTQIAALSFIELTGKIRDIECNPEILSRTRTELIKLIRSYDQPDQAYVPRLRPNHLSYASDYDHLSRLGEWVDGDPYLKEKIR
ncbi:MAG: double-strand break repair protein AddB [Pseudomonadota bacterium]